MQYYTIAIVLHCVGVRVVSGIAIVLSRRGEGSYNTITIAIYCSLSLSLSLNSSDYSYNDYND